MGGGLWRIPIAENSKKIKGPGCRKVAPKLPQKCRLFTPKNEKLPQNNRKAENPIVQLLDQNTLENDRYEKMLLNVSSILTWKCVSDLVHN